MRLQPGGYMGKRTFITLVIVAIIAAAAPPLFGFTYERQIREQVASAPENTLMIFELADYQRGLYTSHGTLRFALSDGYIEQLRNALDTSDPASPRTPEQQATLDSMLEFLSAELLFDIDVQHGPVMFANGLSVGLATVRSQIVSTTGKLAEFQKQLGLPYLLQVDAQVDLDGSADFQADIPPFSNSDADFSIDFSGLNYGGRFDRSNTSVKAQGGTDRFLIDTDGMQIVIEDIGLMVDSKMLVSNLWLGHTSIEVGEVHLKSPDSMDGASFDLLGLGFDADVGLNDAADKFTIEIVYRIAGISGLPDSEIENLKVGMRFRNIDREAIEEYLLLAQEMGFADPDAMEKMLPAFQSIGNRILRGSPGVDLSPVEVILNGEPFAASIGIDFDGSALPEDLVITNLANDPGLLIAALSAAGQIESSEALAKTVAETALRVQIAQGVPPDGEITGADIEAAARQQAEMVIDGAILQGLIKREGGQLKVDISYADGQLFVNDVPIPLGL
jgi:uncharacterized protein YdgA (DUF945 family)